MCIYILCFFCTVYNVVECVFNSPSQLCISPADNTMKSNVPLLPAKGACTCTYCTIVFVWTEVISSRQIYVSAHCTIALHKIKNCTEYDILPSLTVVLVQTDHELYLHTHCMHTDSKSSLSQPSLLCSDVKVHVTSPIKSSHPAARSPISKTKSKSNWDYSDSDSDSEPEMVSNSSVPQYTSWWCALCCI